MTRVALNRHHVPVGEDDDVVGEGGNRRGGRAAVSTKPDVATKAPASRTLIARPSHFRFIPTVDVPTDASAGPSPEAGAASIQESCFPLMTDAPPTSRKRFNGRSHQIAQRRFDILLNANLRLAQRIPTPRSTRLQRCQGRRLRDFATSTSGRPARGRRGACPSRSREVVESPAAPCTCGSPYGDDLGRTIRSSDSATYGSRRSWY